MSDPRASYGEPVDEPKDGDDDVIRRAQAGLAEAEAARSGADPAEATTGSEPQYPARYPENGDAADPAYPAASEPVAPAERSDVEPVAAERETPSNAYDRTTDAPASTPLSSTSTSSSDDDEARWAAYAASADTVDDGQTARVAQTSDDRTQAYRTDDDRTGEIRGDETPTVVAAPVVTSSEPVPPAAPSAFGASAQPIFVQAPEAPNPRGNRGAAGAIGLLAALAFAVLYLAATLGFGLLYGDFALNEVLDETLALLTTWSLWVPVVVFYLAFWFLGAIINRGRWGHWVVWGLLVGVAAWGGHILGQLFQAPFWTLTARQGAELIEAQALAPLGIVAFVLGRELTIWFGAWVARRGKRMTELNDEAQREYERTLEAGPQLHHG